MAHLITALFIIVNCLFAGTSNSGNGSSQVNNKPAQKKEKLSVIGSAIPHRGERFVRNGRTYVLVDQLGSGAFANVFEVRASEGKSEVGAIKVFSYGNDVFQSNDPQSNSEAAKIREVLISGNRLIQDFTALDPIHPLSFPPQLFNLPLNPLRLKGESDSAALSGKLNQETAVFMPLGRSVLELLVNLQSEHDRIKMASQILKNVSQELIWLGQRGAIHRDINPRNILMKSNGRFGLADYDTSIKSGTDSYRMTTPRFAAPETMGEVTMLRPVSDMYSLGLTLLYVIDPEFRAIRVNFGSTANFSVSQQILREEIEKAKLRLFEVLDEKIESKRRIKNPNTLEMYLSLRTFLEASLIQDPGSRSSAILNIKGFRDYPEYSGVETDFGGLDVDLNVTELKAKIARSQSEVSYIFDLLNSVRTGSTAISHAANLVASRVKDPKTKITIALETNYARTLEILNLASALSIEIPQAQESLSFVIPKFPPRDPEQFELLRNFLNRQKSFSKQLMEVLYAKYFHTTTALQEIQAPLWLALKIGREWPHVLGNRQQLISLLRHGEFPDRFVKYRVACLLIDDANMTSETRETLEEMLKSAGLEPSLKRMVEGALAEQKKLSQIVLKFSTAPIKKLGSLLRSALSSQRQPSAIEAIINQEGNILPALHNLFKASAQDGEGPYPKFTSAEYQLLTEAFLNGSTTQRANSKIVLANIARLSSNLIPMFVVKAIEENNPGYQFREIIGLYAFAQPAQGPQSCHATFNRRAR